MPLSSVRRAQTEPLAALAAVAVLGFALSIAVMTFADAPVSDERNVAKPAMARVLAVVRPGAVLLPGRLEEATDVAPARHHLAVTVWAGNRTWAVGPDPPPSADAVTRAVPVRTGPDRVRPGRISVEVWR